MRGTGRAVVPVIVAAVALAGCSPSGGTDTGAGTGKNGDGAPVAGAAPEKGVTLGTPGSACELPVTFALVAGWEPEAVKVDPDSELAELGRQGSATMVCEIDAKPAGNIGYLRVWQGEGSTAPRAALEDFVAGDANAAEASYKESEAGTVPAVEVTYTVEAELLDERRTERAFAVTTPKGPVVVHLGGLDPAEHEAMLPAYELARKTLRLG